tara:strand:+ start:16496 stop:16762 length:267 start_codon:yes stop_codon:yes gene_type:complete
MTAEEARGITKHGNEVDGILLEIYGKITRSAQFGSSICENVFVCYDDNDSSRVGYYGHASIHVKDYEEIIKCLEMQGYEIIDGSHIKW